MSNGCMTTMILLFGEWCKVQVTSLLKLNYIKQELSCEGFFQIKSLTPFAPKQIYLLAKLSFLIAIICKKIKMLEMRWIIEYMPLLHSYYIIISKRNKLWIFFSTLALYRCECLLKINCFMFVISFIKSTSWTPKNYIM